MNETMYDFTHWPTPEAAGITDIEVRHIWHERVAIATIDGGLDEQTARALAWRELGRVAVPADTPRHRVRGPPRVPSADDRDPLLRFHPAPGPQATWHGHHYTRPA